MSVQDEKLARFVKAVDSEVDSQIAALLHEAETEKQQLIENANDESLAAAYSRIQEEVKHVSAKYQRIIAKEELDAKKSVLLHREELIDKLFDSVKLKLTAFAAGEKYPDYLLTLPEGDMDGAVIRLSARDMRHAPILEKKFGVKCETDESIKVGGLIVYYPEKGVMLDKTLDTAVADARREFNQKGGAELKI